MKVCWLNKPITMLAEQETVPPFLLEDHMMKQKKLIEITGRLVFPIKIGASALIEENEGLRKTSTVLRVKNSQSEIQFETMYTNYLLHIAPSLHTKTEEGSI